VSSLRANPGAPGVKPRWITGSITRLDKVGVGMTITNYPPPQIRTSATNASGSCLR
jgi:hypothetical protein